MAHHMNSRMINRVLAAETNAVATKHARAGAPPERKGERQENKNKHEHFGLRRGACASRRVIVVPGQETS